MSNLPGLLLGFGLRVAERLFATALAMFVAVARALGRALIRVTSDLYGRRRHRHAHDVAVPRRYRTARRRRRA